MEIRVTTGEIDGYRFGEIADYPDETAKLLVSLGYAEYAGEHIAEEPAEEPAEDSLASMRTVTEPPLDELKDWCRELGLPTSGKKADLIARIEDALAEGSEVDADEEEPPELSAEVPR